MGFSPANGWLHSERPSRKVRLRARLGDPPGCTQCLGCRVELSDAMIAELQGLLALFARRHRI